jgi:hypothetical protein
MGHGSVAVSSATPGGHRRPRSEAKNERPRAASSATIVPGTASARERGALRGADRSSEKLITKYRRRREGEREGGLAFRYIETTSARISHWRGAASLPRDIASQISRENWPLRNSHPTAAQLSPSFCFITSSLFPANPRRARTLSRTTARRSICSRGHGHVSHPLRPDQDGG